MKVALVTHRVVRGDGQGRVNFELARHCLRQGMSVSLFAEEVDQQLLEEGASWYRVIPRFARPRLLKVASFARAADRLLTRMGYKSDITVGNGFTLTHPHQVNVCHFVHDGWRRSAGHDAQASAGLRSCYQFAYTHYNVRRERESFTAARTVVAVSDMVKAELLASGAAGDKVQVIANGVDLNEFQPGAECRKSLGLPEKEVLALFVGDLRTGRKNLATVLQALTRVPRIHLAIAGSTEGSDFPRMADKLGLSARVHFLGFRKDIARLMRACDLFIFPSHYEPFGLALLEALACGLPVVTARTVGASAIVSDSCGRIIEQPADVAALAAAMNELANSPARRRRLSQGARAAAEAHSWSKTAERYVALFGEQLT